MKQDIGGNLLNSFDPNETQTLFADDAYKYYKILLKDGEKHQIKDLTSYTVMKMENGEKSSLSYQNDGQKYKVQTNEAIQIENKSLTISSNGKSLVYIAGVKIKVTTEKSFNIFNQSQIKHVEKPWGYEKWINGEHPGYAFKNIFIKAGNCTSLQYHEIKRETNILFEGKALLHYKNNENTNNDDVLDSDIATFELNSNDSIDVWPNILHRLEALTDINLFEVSTPHLDDVIRVRDSANRKSGRIESEHG